MTIFLKWRRNCARDVLPSVWRRRVWEATIFSVSFYRHIYTYMNIFLFIRFQFEGEVWVPVVFSAVDILSFRDGCSLVALCSWDYARKALLLRFFYLLLFFSFISWYIAVERATLNLSNTKTLIYFHRTWLYILYIYILVDLLTYFFYVFDLFFDTRLVMYTL